MSLIVIVDSRAITHATDIEIKQIINNPAKFDGQLVRVTGFMHLEFEGEAIYIREQDYRKLIFRNGIWLDLSDSQSRWALPLNDHFVTIEGMFCARERGHFGLWSGSIKKISKVKATKSDIKPGIIPSRDNK